MKETLLTKLYKKRGSPNELKNHCFKHGKSYGGKILEKCVVAVMYDAIARSTPECQVGGLQGQSTVDHIMTVVCTASINEKLNKPTIATLVDIKAEQCASGCW